MAPSPLRRSSRKRKTVVSLKYDADDDVEDNDEEFVDHGDDDDSNTRENTNIASKKIKKDNGSDEKMNDNVQGHRDSDGNDDKDDGDDDGDDDGEDDNVDADGKTKLKTRKRKSTRRAITSAAAAAAATTTSSPKKKKVAVRASSRPRSSPTKLIKTKKHAAKGNKSSDDEDDEYKDDEYKDDDEDEDYNEVTPSSNKRKRKTDVGRSGQKSKSSKQTKKSRDYGSVEDRTCPFCKKVFSIVTGLAYHIGMFCYQVNYFFSVMKELFLIFPLVPKYWYIEHKVCQREAGTQSNRKKKNMSGKFPYPKLEPGSKFITQYGVVQVISDGNIPPDHNKTCIPMDIKDKVRTYNRKRKRIHERRANVITYSAKKQRKRRHDLMKIYLKSLEGNREEEKQGKDGNGNGGSNEEEACVSLQIWKHYCSLTTPSLILSGTYNQNMDDKMLTQIQTVEKHPWNDLGIDPSEPEDSYPNRIVECVLIRDERKKICDVDIQAEGEGRISQMKEAKKSVEKAKMAQSRKNKCQNDGDTACGEKTSDGEVKTPSAANLHESGMKLYLQRKILVHTYNTKIANYQCKNCGQNFYSRMGLKSHCDELTCVKRIEKVKQERALRLQEIEDAALSNNIKAPQPLFTPKKPVAPGQTQSSKTKRKKHKKWPAWLEFYPTLSPIYPEIFEAMKFKRGSNNSKFMQKKWDAIGPGRKRVRKSRAKKSHPEKDALSVVKDDVQAGADSNSRDSVYPEVMVFLFPELQNPSRTGPSSSKRKVSSTAKTKEIEKLSVLQDGKVQMNHTPTTKTIDSGNSHIDLSSTTIKLAESEIPTACEEAIMPPLPDTPLPVPVSVAAESPMIASPAPKMNGQVEVASTSKPVKNEEATSSLVKSQEDIKDDKEPTPKKRRRRKRTPVANPKPATPFIVDIRPLVEEIRAGRYPSMKEYTGNHLHICVLCKNRGDDVNFCEFCSNAEHLACVQSKVTIRDPEPDDAFMCHSCIQTVLARRARAEKRRLQKLDEAMGISAGGSGVDTTVQEAKAAAALKREIVWNQADFNAHVVSYAKCPSGGPGGLICCASCTAAYSRQLSETSKEMDSQTVSSVGREVSELIQLLHDAQKRLQQSVDISNANDTRMSLLNREQVGFEYNLDDSTKTANENSVVGFMDVFGK